MYLFPFVPSAQLRRALDVVRASCARFVSQPEDAARDIAATFLLSLEDAAAWLNGVAYAPDCSIDVNVLHLTLDTLARVNVIPAPIPTADLCDLDLVHLVSDAPAVLSATSSSPPSTLFSAPSDTAAALSTAPGAAALNPSDPSSSSASSSSSSSTSSASAYSSSSTSSSSTARGKSAGAGLAPLSVATSMSTSPALPPLTTPRKLEPRDLFGPLAGPDFPQRLGRSSEVNAEDGSSPRARVPSLSGGLSWGVSGGLSGGLSGSPFLRARLGSLEPAEAAQLALDADALVTLESGKVVAPNGMEFASRGAYVAWRATKQRALRAVLAHLDTFFPT